MPKPQHTWRETLAVYRDLVGQLHFEPEGTMVNPLWALVEVRELNYSVGQGFKDLTGSGRERSLSENSYG